LNGKFQQDVKMESAHSLACVGFVLAESNDFKSFLNWLWDSMKKARKEKVQALFLHSLASLLKMKPVIPESEIAMITTDIQDLLEQTESSEIMQAAVQNFCEISRWKPHIFESHFQSVVDLLVGWHLDSSQPPESRTFLATVLLSWHQYWVLDMEFSNSLLKQLMEDLETHCEDFLSAKRPEEKQKTSSTIISLIQVFNTVLGCLRSRQKHGLFSAPGKRLVVQNNSETIL
jgi:hypothetical protein